MTKNVIDLNTCKEGDILLCSNGAKLKYLRKTTESEYLDHYVQYIELPDGTKPEKSYGTRTNDGFVFKNIRKPSTDQDVIEIQRINPKKMNKNKFFFIAEHDIADPFFVKKTEQQNEFESVSKSLQKYFCFKSSLSKKWQDSSSNFEVIKSENLFKIRCIKDRICIAELENEDLAKNIVDLMNLAYREGVKDMLLFVKEKFGDL